MKLVALEQLAPPLELPLKSQPLVAKSSFACRNSHLKQLASQALSLQDFVIPRAPSYLKLDQFLLGLLSSAHRLA